MTLSLTQYKYFTSLAAMNWHFEVESASHYIKDDVQMTVALSKFLSFVLRHKPDAIGLTLDPQGWVPIDDLIAKSDAAGTRFSRDDLLHVVESSEKKRFSISTDGQRIRAAQGHSVSVELGLPPQQPPSMLYHGTAAQFVDSIFSEGLKPQSRQQVHLSADEATAHRIGQRHGKPAILKVEALRMHAQGFKFFLTDNGVWLTDQVPPEFLLFERDHILDC